MARSPHLIDFSRQVAENEFQIKSITFRDIAFLLRTEWEVFSENLPYIVYFNLRKKSTNSRALLRFFSSATLPQKSGQPVGDLFCHRIDQVESRRI